jgi:hypothetical protein
MAVWLEPIFDRTQADVEFALQMIAEWTASRNSQGGYELKGCLNVSDINRIEGNIAYLAETLEKYHYRANVETREWSMSDLPTEEDIARIVNNTYELLKAYYVPYGTPSLPKEMSSYSEVNDVEQILSFIKVVLDSMIGSFKRCNTFRAGSKVILPTKRMG